MKKIIYILLISLLLTNLSKAQVSGYMGKKWLLTYDVFARPSFSMPNINGKNGFTSFNAKNSFGLEFVTGEHSSIGISYSFFKTMFDFRELQINLDNNSTAFSSTFHPSGFGSMSVKEYSFYFKSFIGGNIAPLGSYVKFSFDYFSWDSYYYWKQNIYSDPDLNTFVKTLPENNSNSSYGISLSFGNQRIYFDHLVLNTSLQFGVLFNGGYTALFGDTSPTSTPPNYIDALKYATSARVFSYNAWSINIGLGYLLF